MAASHRLNCFLIEAGTRPPAWWEALAKLKLSWSDKEGELYVTSHDYGIPWCLIYGAKPDWGLLHTQSPDKYRYLPSFTSEEFWQVFA